MAPRVCCSPRQLQLFSLFIATVTLVTVLIILFLFNYPSLARRRIVEAVVFRNGTLEMDRFSDTSDLKNLRIEFYMYNVTNAEQVVANGSKINLQEVGPFVYHELKTKEFLDNNQTSGLITYKLLKRYTFQRQLSVGDPRQMNITWPNVPLIAARAFIDKLPTSTRGLAYLFINRAIKTKQEPAFITDSVEKFIFSGSKRELFEYLQSYDLFHLIKPWPLPDNKFAVFYDRNETWYPWRDHTFTMAAGFGVNQSYEALNQYIYMNQSSTLPYWNNEPPQCNKLEGTDGEFFHPFLNTNESLVAYSTDICRKLDLKFKQIAYMSGILTHKYVLDERSLQSGSKYSPNQCYCLRRDSTGGPLPECDLDGLIDLSTCVVPNVVASGAHFLHGSPELTSRFTGLKAANASVDQPVTFVEPNTGLTVQVRVPLQLNVRLERGGFNLFDFFKDDNPLIVPLFHLAESAELTDDQATLLRSKLLLLDSWLVSMVLGGVIIVIITIVAALVILYMRYRNSRQLSGSVVTLPSNDAEDASVEAATPEPSETDPLIPRQ